MRETFRRLIIYTVADNPATPITPITRTRTYTFERSITGPTEGGVTTKSAAEADFESNPAFWTVAVTVKSPYPEGTKVAVAIPDPLVLVNAFLRLPAVETHETFALATGTVSLSTFNASFEV